MIGNVVRTRVNDMEMMLREEDEAAAGGGGGTGGGMTSGERVMRDDELSRYTAAHLPPVTESSTEQFYHN
jgi:hypothetical protein